MVDTAFVLSGSEKFGGPYSKAPCNAGHLPTKRGLPGLVCIVLVCAGRQKAADHFDVANQSLAYFCRGKKRVILTWAIAGTETSRMTKMQLLNLRLAM